MLRLDWSLGMQRTYFFSLQESEEIIGVLFEWKVLKHKLELAFNRCPNQTSRCKTFCILLSNSVILIDALSQNTMKIITVDIELFLSLFLVAPISDHYTLAGVDTFTYKCCNTRTYIKGMTGPWHGQFACEACTKYKSLSSYVNKGMHQ